MAAIETLDSPTPNGERCQRDCRPNDTASGGDELPTRQRHSFVQAAVGQGTAALIEPEECGDEELRNEAEPAGRFQPTKVADTEEW